VPAAARLVISDVYTAAQPVKQTPAGIMEGVQARDVIVRQPAPGDWLRPETAHSSCSWNTFMLVYLLL
jgi:hypothetical protein